MFCLLMCLRQLVFCRLYNIIFIHNKSIKLCFSLFFLKGYVIKRTKNNIFGTSIIHLFIVLKLFLIVQARLFNQVSILRISIIVISSHVKFKIKQSRFTTYILTYIIFQVEKYFSILIGVTNINKLSNLKLAFLFGRKSFMDMIQI